jgi:hypothetical protein
MNLESIHVANYQERRVLKCFAILQKLIVCCDQIFVLAFVFPAKKIAFPDISPTLTATMLGGTFLKSEALTCRICFSRRGVLEDCA